MEEHQLRISEINDANSNYQRQAEILNEKMLILKQEEQKHSELKLKDEELEHSTVDEELKLEEVMQILQFSGASAKSQSVTIGVIWSVVYPSVCPSFLPPM
jgi:hypothetical protein